MEFGVPVVPHFKKGDQRVCSNYWGITLLIIPGQVYSGMLVKRVQLLLAPQIQEKHLDFRPGCGTLDQLYTLERVMEGAWMFVQSVQMCFVHLEKAYYLKVICRRCSRSIGYMAFCYGLFTIYIVRVSAWFALLAVI